jgi:ATPase family protein associated with various cellular activities (AAA)
MWSQNGSVFKLYEKSEELEFLPVGVYTLNYGAFGSMYLNMMKPEFEFPYKLYGEDGFPERVIKTYTNGVSNLGVLLCGLKGTGKTVQAEQICNLSKLPVILVSQDFDKGADLISYLSNVNQEVVVMIDEYEKLFGKSDSLLSIMDGAFNANSRRLFVLTANTMNISEAMIDRPSRIHYLKKFGNLAVKVIGEVVADLLDDQSFRSEVIEYLGALDIITIDIVKTVVKEVNLFQEPPQKFKEILNISYRNHARWDVFEEDNTPILEYVTCDLIDPFRDNRYDYLRFREFGEKYHEFGIVKTSNKKTGKIVTENGTYIVKKAKSFATTVHSRTMGAVV